MPQKPRPIVSKEFSGQWIAWNRSETRIVANGQTFTQVKEAAEQAGERNPILEKVLRADRRFVGEGG